MFNAPDPGGDPGGEAGGGDAGWMGTWADAITVLLGFFVVLFSMADLDKSKFQEVRRALSADVRVEEPLPEPVADTRAGPELARRLKEMLQEATFAGEIRVERLPAGVVVELPADTVFDAKGALRPGVLPDLSTLAWEIRQPDMRDYMIEVQVLGEITESGRQAVTLTRFLAAQGVPAERLRATAFSSLSPMERKSRGGALPQPEAPTLRLLLERI